MPKPKIVILDDDEFYLTTWRKTLEHYADIVCFESPFILHSFMKKTNTAKIDLVIIDYKLGGINAAEINIAGTIRNLGYKKKILMCSLLKHFGEYDAEVRKCFDGFLRKKVLSLELSNN